MTSQLSTTSPEVLRVVWLGLAPVSSIGTISKYAMACLAGLVPYVKPKKIKAIGYRRFDAIRANIHLLTEKFNL